MIKSDSLSSVDFRSRAHLRIHHLLLVLISFSIPLEPRIPPVLIGLLVLNWIIEWDWKNKIQNLFVNKLNLLPVLLYLFYVAGLLLTENMEYGMQDLETKASLILFPLVLSSRKKFEAKHLDRILNAFMFSCFIGMFICIGHSIYSFYDEIYQVKIGLLHDTYTNWDFFFSSRLSYFLHPSYYAMFICMAMIFLFRSIFIKKMRQSRIILIVLVNILFSVFIFFLASRMGFITMLLTWTGVVFYLVIKRRLYKWGALTFLVMVFSSLYLYTHSQIIASRIDFMISTFETPVIDKTSSESSGVRVLIWKVARATIAEHPLLGVGTGDVKDVLLEKYREEGMTGALERRLNAHDQFFQTSIAIGLIGGMFLVSIFIFPLLYKRVRNNYLLVFFIFLIILNFLVESMLETQAGVIFFAFFYAVLFSAERFTERSGPMRILILTQYFPPEIGAPQNRLFELAVRLRKNNAEVEILTAMPNYPQMEIQEKYKGRWRYYETMDEMNVYRSWIFVSKSKGIVKRLLNYFSFVKTSFFAGWLRAGDCDVIICESPPLFLGISAYLLKKIKGAKLIFNVSDLWPESAEKLGLVKNKLLLGVSKYLEEFLYKHSELVTGQTQGIVKDISTRFPKKPIHWLPNGVDLNYYRVGAENGAAWRKKINFNSDDFVLLYAGIIGHAQGLEVIIKAADRLKEQPKIKFVLLGSGPEKEKLLKLQRELKAENVFFLDAVSKAEMPEIVAACDATIIPLKRLDLFKGAIPSKIFECLALKKPVLLGVEGEAKELFIDKGKCGLAFIPEDDSDLANKIMAAFNDPSQMKQFGENGLEYVRTNFNRDTIANEFRNVLNRNFGS